MAIIPGKRFSTLSQINQSNVRSLTLAWVTRTQSVAIKSMPLEVNGILYFTTPDNVWAADARSGQIIWHYYRESQGGHIGNRGVGMYKDWLYFETPDCHLISLNAKDGKVRWDIELADPKLGYFATMAAARHSRSRDCRSFWRCDRHPWISGIGDAGYRQSRMAMEYGARTW